MALSHGDLVDPDDGRRGNSGPPDLFPHVLAVQFLDALPVQPELLGHIPNRHGPTTSSHHEGKSLGVERMVGGPRQFLLFHGLALPAEDTPDLHFQVNPLVAAG